MTPLTIDRLSLRLGGLSELDARRLARLVAAGLAGAALDLDGAHRLERVEVQVTAAAEDIDHLAEQIVADLLRQIGRAL
jgi:hypothetical protein